MTAYYDHEAAQFYWSADSDDCPHTQPDYETEGDAWDLWRDRHPSSDDGPICLDAPAGICCPACSAEHGDPVPWDRCEGRDHVRPKRGMVPNPDAEHQPVQVWVGGIDCVERECDEYFTDDGDERPDVEVCSHIREETTCSCRRRECGEYALESCPLVAA
ncbi:hypothetical protein ACF061_00990 [Streptomyces sp. NPDC015220]|uniref:hypothetical protein n=1 Tax=Streptomyces sp. NPDC015220 TaxID=3364947 RepID=UPI0036FD5829